MRGATAAEAAADRRCARGQIALDFEVVGGALRALAERFVVGKDFCPGRGVCHRPELCTGIVLSVRYMSGHY